MRKITDIYEEYKIMPNLQTHQLRVTAVAQQICDSLDVLVDRNSILTACLLHDMGNIIKFKLDYFPEFNEPQGLVYWEEVQSDYIKKYGEDEHHATIKIVKELGQSNLVASLIDVIDFKHVDENGHKMSIEEKICVYVDNRVSPHSIVSLYERAEEARHRYKDHRNRIEDIEHMRFLEKLEVFEQEIFSHSTLKPENITNESSFPIIESLREFQI